MHRRCPRCGVELGDGREHAATCPVAAWRTGDLVERAAPDPGRASDDDRGEPDAIDLAALERDDEHPGVRPSPGWVPGPGPSFGGRGSVRGDVGAPARPAVPREAETGWRGVAVRERRVHGRSAVEVRGDAAPSRRDAPSREAEVAPACARCGSRPAITVELRRNVGLLLVSRYSWDRAPRCRDCGRHEARSWTNRTLWLGWWGLLAWAWNLAYVVNNAVALRRFARLPPPDRAGPRRPAEPGRPVFLRSACVVLAATVVCVVVLLLFVRGPVAS